MKEHPDLPDFLSVQNPEKIKEYHIHVYYDPEKSRRAAEILRQQISQLFPDVRLGRWHDQPVGPHPQSMYQIAFQADLFGSIVPWLLLNRRGLTLLLHPETGDEYKDHAEHAAWLGAMLSLRLEVFTPGT